MIAIHFVGFRDERYWSAVKIWGKPDFIHPLWDRRAMQDADEGDVFVFAKGDETWSVAEYSWNDSERM